MKREFSQKDSFSKGRLGEIKTITKEGYEKGYLRQRKLNKNSKEKKSIRKEYNENVIF